MVIRRRRLIRPSHKLPTKAEKLAAEAAERKRIDNVINRPAAPPPEDRVQARVMEPFGADGIFYRPGQIADLSRTDFEAHYARGLVERPVEPSLAAALRDGIPSQNPLAGVGASLAELSRSFQSIGRVMRGAPSRQASAGFRVREVEYSTNHDVVKISAMDGAGVMVTFSMPAANYEQLRCTGSLDPGAMLEIRQEIDVLERHVIGELAPRQTVGRRRVSIATENSDFTEVTDFVVTDDPYTRR